MPKEWRNKNIKRSVTAAVTKVHKFLLSVRSLVKKGNSVYFGPDRCVITNIKTGEEIDIQCVNGVYQIVLEVKESDIASTKQTLGNLGLGLNP